MGKTVKKVLTAGLIIVSAGLLIPVAFAAGFSAVGFGLVGVQVLGVSKLFDAFAPELDFGSDRLLAENLSIFSSPVAVRGVPFGRVGIAGQVLFRHNIKNSGDTPDELLLILGLSGYPATSLEKFWFNGELVFDGDSTTGPGAITTGTFANDLWVWFRTGEETSAAFADIGAISAAWSAKTRILRGIPSIGIRIKITEKVDGKLEPLAQFKGAKLYDPRLDSTVPGGSGTHRFATPSTWEWSENPKLAELIYLRGAEVNGTRIFGMGKSEAAIDLENLASEANICEEQIGVVGGGTIDRYTCNGLLIPSSDHKSNLQKLLSASAGTMDASGGIYRTFAGAWRASSMTLTESDIDGAPTEMQLQIDQSDEFNIISGVFADPLDNWVVKEYPERTDSASIALFGENAKKLDLPFTIDHRIAQRISKIQLKRLNAKRAFNANYWMRAVSLQPGDNVTQTYARYGITSETFRVDFWALEASQDRQSNRRLVVPLRLIEEQQSWFDWDELTEEQTANSAGVLPSVSRLPRLITLDEGIVFEGSVPPADPKIGWLWLDTDVNIVFRWSGSAWVEFSRIGADAVYGFIEPENGIAWTRATTAGAWTPSQLTTDLDCSFKQNGIVVARIARRITLTEVDGTLAATTVAHKGGDLNTSRVTVTVSGSASTAITVQFAYSFDSEDATVPQTVTSSQGGDDGVLHYLTNEAHVIPSDADGGGYDTAFTGAGGTHKVFEGTTDETANAVHEIVGGTDGGANWTKVQNGLTLTVVEATGVYSLSGAAWITDTEVFTLRAVFNGVNYDKVYTIAKAIAGSPGASGSAQLTGAALVDVSVTPTDAEVGYQLKSDGWEESYEGFGVAFSRIAEWLLAGSPGDYDCRLTVDSGTAPAGSATGSWLALSSARAWTLTDSGVAGPVISNSCTIEIRHGTTLTVLATKTVTMSVHEEA